MAILFAGVKLICFDFLSGGMNFGGIHLLLGILEGDDPLFN